jgi:hypothetical protein
VEPSTTSAYRFDPEITPLVPALPRRDITDLTAARAAIVDGPATAPAVDTTGVLMDERDLPAGVRVRIYRPASGPRGRSWPPVLDRTCR